jgi:hypothetical protein
LAAGPEKGACLFQGGANGVRAIIPNCLRVGCGRRKSRRLLSRRRTFPIVIAKRDAVIEAEVVLRKAAVKLLCTSYVRC